jgi:hypothetical protein
VAREHDPGLAAAAVVAACRELAELSPPGDAPARVPPPTSLSWGAPVGALTLAGAEPPWPEGTRRRLRLRLTNRGPARWLAARRGPGGLAFEVRLLGENGETVEAWPWRPLPSDVAVGEHAELEHAVRRPRGRAWLAVEPKVMDAVGVAALAGPVWTAEV